MRPAEPGGPRPAPHEARPGAGRPVRSGSGPLWRSTRLPGTGPLRQAGALYAWVIVVVTVVQLFLYPALRGSLHSHWALIGVQSGVYLLLVAPVAVWFPQTLKLLRAPGWQIGLGLAVVAAALAYQSVGHHAGALELLSLAVTFGPVGFIEELLFRGFIWERCRQAGAGPALVVGISTISFAFWHVPSVLIDHGGPTELAWDTGLGLVLSLVRLWSGNTALGGLLHAAWDISGGL